MVHRVLGSTELTVSPIAFGAFKIGRNQGIKYPSDYPLPDQREVEVLLNGILDMGINLIDTAPAYGTSEQRIGKAVGQRRGEYILATKIGERFSNGQSTYDFSAPGLTESLEQSLRHLKTDAVDLLHIHSDGRDQAILSQTDAVEAILNLKAQGKTRFVGFSGKTIEGAVDALPWADTLMLEYNPDHRQMSDVIQQAAEQGVGVLVKKPLGSGHLEPQNAIEQALLLNGVSTLVVGSLSLDHLRQNLGWAMMAD